jgi:2-oxoglutarate ferredoxin oxidoreductase subunit alpha
MDYSIRIGGAAGQGMQTIGDALAKAFARLGYHVFTHQDYESRIRGGHNYYQVRVSNKPVTCSREGIDIVIALDRESIVRHAGSLRPNGQLIYDAETLKEQHDGPVFSDIPFGRLALEHGGNHIMENMAATGAVIGMLGMQPDILFGIIREIFLKKGDEIIEANIRVAAAGYAFALTGCPACRFTAPAAGRPRMLIGSVDAIALGALASGVKFYAAYPMTPSTGIMNFIADRAMEFGVIVEQAEDEIAAINMALGASFGGVRAMTGTSGGGLALMVEGISLAAMTETPVVIALGQRPGPATGFPTRTEQGELQFVVSLAHGEFPRIVFAPGTPEQAFLLTNKAFDLAEKYQVPVFILFDQYLSDALWTCDGFDLRKLVFTDYRLRADQLRPITGYQRHAYTETGVTPLAVPGASPNLVMTDSDEHDEAGHLVEDAETRMRMMDKRLFRKAPRIQAEIAPPTLYGSTNPEIVLCGWGSSYGVLREAVDALSQHTAIALLHFSEVYPFPSTGGFDYLELLRSAPLTVCVEQNATGQFARLMRAETGYVFTRCLNRYDGRPFLLEDIVGAIDGNR